MTTIASRHNRNGFTLVEIMVVVVIMLIMISAIIGVGKVVHDNAREKMTRTTIGMLIDALQEYKSTRGRTGERFVFPVFNGAADVTYVQMLTWLSQADNLGPVVNTAVLDGSGDHDAVNGSPPPGWNGDRMRAFHSSEILYAVLSDLAGCRSILNRLPQNAVQNNDHDAVAIRSASPNRHLCELYDAWGVPLYYENRGPDNLPLIQSAGKDMQFGTEDDLYSTDL